MKVDFKKFERSLPYASEMYGVYQPLLGWKSSLIRHRTIEGIKRSWPAVTSDLISKMQSNYNIDHTHNIFDPKQVKFDVEPALLRSKSGKLLAQEFDSIIGRRITEEIITHGVDKPDVWHKFTSRDAVRQLLEESSEEIRQEYAQKLAKSAKASAAMRLMAWSPEPVLSAILERESMVAGLLTQLNEKSSPEKLMYALQTPPQVEYVSSLLDTLLWLNLPTNKVAGAALSPIGVVHLFRQYFFEFDSFLGPSVQHLWLSPGGTVELVEISTRKKIVERTVEQIFETTEKSETSTMIQDELSDAVKSENQSNTKLGVSLDTSTSFGNDKIFTSQVNTGTSFDLDQGQKEAREQAHKGLRQQTQKISSEVRKSFKSTFRTVTETTDVNSKRYVIQNTTNQLVNYELRRKMRQVGVQVQDYGTQLCWQTYVDDPGDELGVAKLVHIAAPDDLSQQKDPKVIPQPKAVLPGTPVTNTVQWQYGEDSPTGFVRLWDMDVISTPENGYIFKEASISLISGKPWNYIYQVKTKEDIDAPNGNKQESIKSLEIGVWTGSNGINDDEHPTITLQVTPYYMPSLALLDQIDKENKMAERMAAAEEARIYQDSLFKAARDRIKLASNIQPRKFEELREEERIVIYRKLIRQLLEAAGLKQPDSKFRHIFAELVQMMFDVDRMLYFVAPEWWVPREQRSPLIYFKPEGGVVTGTSVHESPQDIGVKYRKSAFDQNTVSWGGAKEARPNNYYITEDSTPARLGSSLGWLIQLDGDNLRNAFLNAPWVKAVVPIRPGREWEALDWLKSPNIEGSDGLDSLYQASNIEREKILQKLKEHEWNEHPELKTRYRNASFKVNDITIQDAIHYLIVRIQEKQAEAIKKIPDPAEPGSSYLPTDLVYEHGFDPLEDGFQAQSEKPFKVFDQWIEVLPTDQIVPVEVEYDPKTGMQKD